MSTSINERDSIMDKDALIEHLRDELTTLGRQVEEFQDLEAKGERGVFYRVPLTLNHVMS